MVSSFCFLEKALIMASSVAHRFSTGLWFLPAISNSARTLNRGPFRRTETPKCVTHVLGLFCCLSTRPLNRNTDVLRPRPFTHCALSPSPYINSTPSFSLLCTNHPQAKRQDHTPPLRFSSLLCCFSRRAGTPPYPTVPAMVPGPDVQHSHTA